jgi:tRNA-2-methylthio-N6-dimethylallyladenosine synthase
MRRVLIQTFGCQMNVHDSRRIAEVLDRQGYELTDEAELADLIVLNTCSVREKAEHKLVSHLGTLRPLKQRRQDLVIAVAGCMAQEYGEELLDRLDLVDVLVGPDNVPELPELVARAREGERLARAEHDLIEPRFLVARPDGREVSSFVTVMKCCDERCSFCIVPYTRGPERYRAADEIVAEIAGLVAGGVREITLLGQTVNSWHPPDRVGGDESSQFAALLRRIAAEVPALARLRYTSPHPRHVTPELVAAHAELAVLPAHVHLPVQSGADRVLKRMIRRYTRASYLAAIRALQAGRPGLTVSTDMIVGFPGETEEDFAQTLSLIEEAGFVSVFGFKYSPRPNTPALKLGDDVSEEVKSDRLDRLFAAVDVLQQRHLAALVGTRAQVLVEGASKGSPVPGMSRFSGRSERHEIVHLDVPTGTDPTGLLMEVEIVEAHKRSLLGRALSPLPAGDRRGRDRDRGPGGLRLAVLPS